MRELVLDRRACQNFELSAAFFAALIHPAVSQDELRTRYRDASCAQILHLTNRMDQTDDPFIDDRLNAYLGMSREDAFKIVEADRKCLDKRSCAARIARPWLSEFVTGRPHRPIEGCDLSSLEQIARTFLAGADPKNLLQRIWRPTKPVLHLAAAIDIYTSSSGAASPAHARQPEQVPFKPDDIVTLRAVVAIAIELQAYIAADPRFRIAAEDIVWLQWIE